MADFTLKQKRTLFIALRDAEDYQMGLADAYGHKGPEASQALKKAKSYFKIREKLSQDLDIPMKTALEMEIDNAELVSLKDLKNMKRDENA